MVLLLGEKGTKVSEKLAELSTKCCSEKLSTEQYKKRLDQYQYNRPEIMTFLQVTQINN